jgi:membrane protease YdiL (CAAX protease family)
MRVLVLVLLGSAVLAFLSDSLKGRLQGAFARRPALVFAAPLALTAVFMGAAALAGAARLALLGLVLAWTLAPTASVYIARAGPKRPRAGDFAAVALLWLPLEFAAGASLVPRAAQGFLHSVAYGVAILLALVLFAGLRALPGMKYNLPRAPRDLYAAALGFAAAAPVLALTAAATGFIGAPHAPPGGAGWMAARAGLIFIGTALPEELLFRSLVQNLLALLAPRAALPLASAIFAAAHLNNGPQPAPNWSYAAVALIAGFTFGKVFQKSGTVLAPAACHAAVNCAKRFFF